MKRLAVITTHPIQYYGPLFATLSRRGKIAVKIFYTGGKASLRKYDPGFKLVVGWDIPLLDDYAYEWVENISRQPGSHHFKGIVNPKLIEKVECYNPDAILIFGWAYQSHLQLMRSFKGKIPLYFRGDSTLIDEAPGPKKWFRYLWLKYLYSLVDHAFFVGTHNKAYLKRSGLKEHQLTFAPHAVDNYRFKASRRSESNYLRLSLNLHHEDILIIFAGKFEKKKSPALLLAAFLKIQSSATHLLFVGNGDQIATLQHMAEGNKNVHFMEFQNQSYMPVIYQACDLFCLPSSGPGETWGLAVNEAMACGKPILASDKVGCAIDLVQEGKNGAIFQAGNGGDLLSKLCMLTKNKKSLVQMGKQSLRIIEQWNILKTAHAIERKIIDEKT